MVGQLHTVQKERDEAKAQIKELLSQIQQYQEREIGTYQEVALHSHSYLGYLTRLWPPPTLEF